MLRPARALDVVVVDESDHPVQGASVEVATADPLPYAALTGENGAARVDRLGPPPYRVRAWARGYERGRPRRRRRSAWRPRPCASAPSGRPPWPSRSSSPDGRRPPAAGVLRLAASTGLWPARQHARRRSSEGAARIGGLHGGVYDLKAQLGEEVSRTELAVAVQRGEVREVKLTLEPGKRVRVLVTDGEGEGAPPIRDASVVLVEEGLSSFPVQGRTGADGAALLGPIARARATVSGRAAGFVARTAAVGEAATEVQLGLVRGGVLAGDVVDDRGYPVAGASLEVIGTDTEGMPIDETSAMIDFRDDRFELSLAGPAPLIPMGELGVMPGPVPDLPHDSAAAQTAGKREHHGEPWVTRADGTFRLDPVPPGHVHLIVRHPAYVEALSEALVIRSGAVSTTHVVLRQGGWIEGRVIEEDRTPVAAPASRLGRHAGSRRALEGPSTRPTTAPSPSPPRPRRCSSPSPGPTRPATSSSAPS